MDLHKYEGYYALPVEERKEFLRVLDYLYGSQSWERICVTAENGSFLLAKEEILGGYREIAEDIKHFVLEACLHIENWGRFSRFASLAFNFDGLTHSLANQEVILALMKNGQVELAADIIFQVANPLSRALLRTEIVSGKLGLSPKFENTQYNFLREDLQAVAKPQDSQQANALLEAIQTIQYALGPSAVEYIKPLNRLLDASSFRHFSLASPAEIPPNQPSSADPLHWILELPNNLNDPNLPINARKSNLWQALAELAAIRYQVPTEIIASALDSAAKLEPISIDLILAHLAAISPQAIEMFIGIAQHTHNPLVLQGILDALQKGRIRFSQDEARGFRSRSDLAVIVACRIFEIQKTPIFPKSILEFLMTDEQDQVIAAAAVASMTNHHEDQSWDLSDQIRSRPLKMVTQLRLHWLSTDVPPGRDLKQLLSFNSLLHAFSHSDVFLDEVQALLALCQDPIDLKKAFGALQNIRDTNRQAVALIDFARHQLYYELKKPERDRDFSRIDDWLQQAFSRLSSEELLFALAPDLLEMAVWKNSEQFEAEFLGAVISILSMETPDELAQIESLALVFGQIQSFFNSTGAAPTGWHPLPFGRLQYLLLAMAQAANTVSNSAAQARLHKYWHWLFPTVWAQSGGSRLNRINAHWLKKAISGWGWLTPEQLGAFEWCLLSQHSFHQLASQLLEGDEQDVYRHEILALVMLHEDETVTSDLVLHIKDRDERDRFSLFLCFSDHLPSPLAQQIEQYPKESPIQARIGALHRLQAKDATPQELTDILLQLAGTQHSPATTCLVRRMIRKIWAIGSRPMQQCLAHSVLASLGNRETVGEDELIRIWIDTQVNLRMGEASPAQEKALEEIGGQISLGSSLLPLKNEPISQSAFVSPEEHRRYVKIYRQWHDPFSIKWTNRFDFKQTIQSAIILFALVFMTFSMPFDILIAKPAGVDLPSFSSIQTWEWAGLAASLGICLLNGWMIHKYLQTIDSSKLHVKPWVVGACWLISCIPLLGLAIIGLWQWIISKKPGWAIDDNFDRNIDKNVSSFLNQFPGLVKIHLQLNLFYRRAWSFYSFWMLILGSAGILNFWGWSFVYRQPSHPVVEGFVAGCGILLHLIVTVGLGSFFYTKANDEYRLGWRRFREFIVLPFFLIPYPLLSMLGLIIWVLLPQRKDPLVKKAFDNRDSLNRLPLWMTLETTLREGWSLTKWWKRISRPGELEQTGLSTPPAVNIQQIYLVKTIALFGDSVYMTWAWLWLQERFSQISGAISILTDTISWVPLVLVSIGILLLVLNFTQSLFQFDVRFLKALQEQPYALYLTATQFAVIAGIILAIGYWENDWKIVGGALLMIGLAGGIGSVLPSILSIIFPLKSSGSIGGFWGTLIMCMLGFSGLEIMLGSDAELHTSLWRMLLVLLPLFHLLSYKMMSRLLHPFSISSRFQSATPAPIKRMLLFLEITATVPFGGLAIPAWLHFRQHYFEGK
jgi:hypothetical protein